MAQIIKPHVLVLENGDADYEKLIMKELKALAKVDDAQLSDQTVNLTTPTTNFTGDKLTMLETKFWAGYTLTNFPDMNNNTTYYLKQRGALPEGVKWGFSAGIDSKHRQWVAAFDSVAKKAYCECGPIGPVDWNLVEAKLALAGYRSEYVDPIFGGRIVAKIIGNNADATLW